MAHFCINLYSIKDIRGLKKLKSRSSENSLWNLRNYKKSTKKNTRLRCFYVRKSLDFSGCDFHRGSHRTAPQRQTVLPWQWLSTSIFWRLISRQHLHTENSGAFLLLPSLGRIKIFDLSLGRKKRTGKSFFFFPPFFLAQTRGKWFFAGCFLEKFKSSVFKYDRDQLDFWVGYQVFLNKFFINFAKNSKIVGLDAVIKVIYIWNL